MGIASRFKGSGDTGKKKEKASSVAVAALADGALDTLSNVVRVMGNESFPLENELDSAVFPQICTEFACHVENGAAVPSYDIPASVDGKRQWGHVRRFFADRRHAEKAFVTKRLQGYRGIVDDLVSGLRDMGLRDQDTEVSVLQGLASIEDAVSSGILPQIRTVLSKTMSQVNKTFARQKHEYEQQLKELNERMSTLRQDLVAAREEMKRDALTEAYNRGAFDAAIVQSLNIHFILQQPFTLLMIDLDDFKQVNDNFGHAAGDTVLKEVGECLARSFIRKNDLIARYGGDEFAVILADTTAKHATSLVERFLNMVREIEIPVRGDNISISCSVGYTEVVAGDAVTDVVGRADQALYQVKADGRNGSAFITAEKA